MQIMSSGTDWMNDGLATYINKFSMNSNWKLSMNWFLRREIVSVLEMLRSQSFKQKIEKKIQLNVAYKVLHCMDDTQLNEILQIFSQYVFNGALYEHDGCETMIDEWKSVYAQICVEMFFGGLDDEVCYNVST